MARTPAFSGKVRDIYADACRRYPQRFGAFGAVHLPHVDAAIAEAERCLDTLGFVGISTGCSVEKCSAGESATVQGTTAAASAVQISRRGARVSIPAL